MWLFDKDRNRGGIRAFAASACLLGAITGCTATGPDNRVVVARPEPITSVPAPVPELLDELLEYGRRLGALSSQALKQEHAQIAGALERDPSAANRIRLALILSRPGTSFRDDKQAKALLEQVTKDARYNTRRYRSLARFLLVMLDDREQVEATLVEERRQRQELQDKLEQLKAIERDFDRRIPSESIKEK